MPDTSKNNSNEVKSNDPNEYLNKTLFHSIISKHLISTPFKVLSVKHSPATAAGQNYLSTILRNNVIIELSNGARNEFSFITKIVGSIMFDESMVDDMKVFPKEVESYINIVPELEKIWKDAAGIDITFAPKLFYHELEPRKILILEDLNATGYIMKDRLNGLSEDEIFVVLQKISMWHAASRVYYDRRGYVDPIFQKGLFNAGTINFFGCYFKLMYTNLIETLQTAGIDDDYMETIKNWDNCIIPNMLRILEIDSEAFNCLSHGDLWINNLMVANSNKSEMSPIDVKFIDFQLGYYGPPVIELIYFLTMSVKHELLTKRFDAFLEYYYRHLKKSLLLLKYYKIPTLKELSISMLEKSFYLTLTMIIALPTLLLDHQLHNIDVTVLQQDSDAGYKLRKKVFAEPVVVSALKDFIEFFGKRGMLDL